MKQREDGEATRVRLITLASQQLRMIGASRLTITSIAAELGMSHANVYRFFPHKAALLDAVLNQWLKLLEARLADIVDGPDPADDKLERFLTTLARGYTEQSDKERSLFALLATPMPEAKEPERHNRRVLMLLTRIVEEGISTRLFGGAEAKRVVQLVFDLAHRFINPASLSMAQDKANDTRQDRVIRATVRSLTSMRNT